MAPSSLNISTARVKSGQRCVDHYTRRRPGRHQAEMDLLARSFPDLPPGAAVLDAPCGAGRVSLWMAARGWAVSAADLGAAAVAHTRDELMREGARADVREADVFQLPWPTRRFQAVVCFRLLHHFADRHARRTLLREMARVSDRYLLVSYLSPFSFTGIRRHLRLLFTGRAHRQVHTPLAELVDDLRAEGFRLERATSQSRGLRSLCLARFVRDRPGPV